MESAAGNAEHFKRDYLRIATRQRLGHWCSYNQKLSTAHPDNHPLGHELLYRNAHPMLQRRIRREVLGLLDAWRHVRWRHGIHLRARNQSRGANSIAADDVRYETRIAARAAV